MKLLRRVLAAAAVLTLGAPAVVAQAEAPVTPVKRISCPTAQEVSAHSGYRLASLAATRTTCWYESAPGTPGQRVEFTYTKDASLDAARSRAEAWGATIEAAPELGDGAFSWQSAGGPANLYWEVSPGAIGTLGGIASHARAVAAAQLFHPHMQVYTVPGEHTSAGRQWRTTCEPYSATARCRTEIWGHRVVADGEGFRREEGWVFNSLTYLWAKRSLWEGNRLATPGTWSQDGRIWRTECDSAATGRGACRTWLRRPTVEVVDGRPRAGVEWVFNNQVLFS